jgi:glutathione-specific gamma-glutamylcyclotransferase
MSDHQLLTRELIESGGIDAIAARDAPAMRILSDLERSISLQSILARRPPGDAWLFGYGSLIWNPTIRFVEQRTARIDGWHRSFCLSTPAGRGSVENPGLVLGLDAGGECTGVAFRIEENKLEAELVLLWRREMLSGAYIPTWVELFDADGRTFGHAIAFAIDTRGCDYAGGLTRPEVVHRLATASGALGSAADYLFRTCDGLRANDICDPQLEALASAVEAARSAPISTSDNDASLSPGERHSGAATRVYRCAGAE